MISPINVTWKIYHSKTENDQNKSQKHSSMVSCHGYVFLLMYLCKGKPPLSGGFTSQRVVMRSSDALYDVILNELFNKRSSCWWFEIVWCSCDIIVKRVLGFGYCVTLACSRIFMGVDVKNNLLCSALQRPRSLWELDIDLGCTL